MTDSATTSSSPADGGTSPAAIFKRLEDHYREYSDLNSALALLSWDQETYMPQAAAASRSNQLKTLSGLAHRHFTDNSVGQMLDALESKSDDLEPLEQRAVSELRRDYDRQVKIPESLVGELAEAQSRGLESWKIAREKSDFSIFAPSLQRLLELRRKVADIWGWNDSPYDALHDAYERDSTAAQLKPLFKELRERLVPLLEKINAAPKQRSRALLKQAFPIDKQWEFTEQVLTDMGFDFEGGRQDKSVHPFSSGIAPGDTRLTTRLNENDFGVGISGTIHEGGHGLYEQGLDEERVGIILADSISLGIHESQSRLWENLIGLSEGFFEYYLPTLKELFPAQIADTEPTVTARDLYEAFNVVSPSLIRVEADEVTYNLHILIRFELELAMVEGDLAIADLPEQWNNKYEQYLGIRPANDAEGCLQDIHWAFGMFGYFPTYTLGNLYSVPFFQAAMKEVPALAEGRVDPETMQSLKAWLNREIHSVGRSETAAELCQRITGSPLTAEPYLSYLERKFEVR